MPATL